MDRITHITLNNVRAVASATLELSAGTTVLIGENGAGKSTFIEALELIRAVTEPDFSRVFHSLHGGASRLLRIGAPWMSIGVGVEDRDGVLPRLAYAVTWNLQEGAGLRIMGEVLTEQPMGETGFRGVLRRRGGSITIMAPGPEGSMVEQEYRGPVSAGEPLLPSLLTENDAMEPAVARMLSALRGIEVQLPFETTASWAAQRYRRPELIRGPSALRPTSRLELLGANLAAAWSELQQRPSDHWSETLDMLRRGLGEQVDTVVVKPDPSGGTFYLGVRFKGLERPVFAPSLSDGQLTWLAFVAMVRLADGRSLLAIDEPEAHMHPGLLGQVMNLLEGTDTPVLLATHSDSLLSMLEDPADAVRVAGLDAQGCVTLRKLDRPRLDRWLRQYGDLGQIAAGGYLPDVLSSRACEADPADGAR